MRFWIAMLGAFALASPPALAAGKPLKVYILAGQSNMQGHASVLTFGSLADDPKTAPLLKKMRDNDGKPRVCDNVWITSVGCQGDAYSDLREQTGKLTVGYGAFGVGGNRVGPEYTFGITMQERLGEPVLLIKTAWGGRSLHTDFRPPSGGPYVWNETELAQMKKRGGDLEKAKAEKVKATGVFYREMISHVQKVLKDVKRVVPDYDEKQGYELAGFVWFQGFNDFVDGGVYPNQMQPGGYDLYADLLGHFVRDVRKDLSAPKLPFVIGVMGIEGLKGDKKAPMMNFRAAQVKPLTLPEFRGNVFAVHTAKYWDDELESLQERVQRFNEKFDRDIKKTDPTLKPPAKEEARQKAMALEFKPEEIKRFKTGISNRAFHYLGAAKILGPIGEACAETLLTAGGAKK
ncbi:MAG: sialate O-acetylesterase [Fimbriiglobus sp.]